jgi:hypothetical protein
MKPRETQPLHPKALPLRIGHPNTPNQDRLNLMGERQGDRLVHNE